jgi:hypothetical protein
MSEEFERVFGHRLVKNRQDLVDEATGKPEIECSRLENAYVFNYRFNPCTPFFIDTITDAFVDKIKQVQSNRFQAFSYLTDFEKETEYLGLHENKEKLRDKIRNVLDDYDLQDAKDDIELKDNRLKSARIVIDPVTRPEFEISHDFVNSNRHGRWGIRETHYRFIPRVPAVFHPDEIFAEFKRLSMNDIYGRHSKVSVVVDTTQYCPKSVPWIEPVRIDPFQRGRNTITAAVLNPRGRRTDFWNDIKNYVTKQDEYDKNDESGLLQSVNFIVRSIDVPYGSGQKSSIKDDLGLIHPQSVVDVLNVKDSVLCGQACLVYAMEVIKGNKKLKELKKTPIKLNKMAQKLGKNIGVKGAMNVSDFDKFVNSIKKYNIRVTILKSVDNIIYKTILKDPFRDKHITNYIYILLWNGHYRYIKNIENFAKPTKKSRKKWCHQCCRMMSQTEMRKHKCINRCITCNMHVEESHFVRTDERCPKCNFKYVFTGCKDMHRCKKWQCLLCDRRYNMSRKEDHICNENYCSHCDEYYLDTHRCFIKTLKSDGKRVSGCWVYDIESTLGAGSSAGPVTLTNGEAPSGASHPAAQPGDDPHGQVSLTGHHRPAAQPGDDPYSNVKNKKDMVNNSENISNNNSINKEINENGLSRRVEVAPLGATTTREGQEGQNRVNAQVCDGPPGPSTAVRVKHRVALVVARELYTGKMLIFDDAVMFLRWVENGDIGKKYLDAYKNIGEVRVFDHCDGGHIGKPKILIAHNGAGYDNYIMLNEIKKHRPFVPENIILAGKKVMCMKYKGCKFIDSYKHITCSLNKMCKAFGIKDQKSDFPYEFFTEENKHYIGPMPDKKYFHDMEWYEQNKTDCYNIFEECIKYCIKDTQLLAECMERYSDFGFELTGLDPLKYVTAASFAQAVHRFKYLDEKKICILNRSEYDFARQSLQGGRTDARQVLREWDEEEVKESMNGSFDKGAFYIDVVSLYPTVQKYDSLPYGEPTMEYKEITENCHKYIIERENNGMLGIIDCHIECPKLYHPVLCSKIDGKLIASLEIKSGTWTSCELIKAIEKGYKITKINKSMWFKGCKDIFSGYINDFVKLKIKYSHGETANPGMRSICKLLLNSLWGKYAQRDIMKETKFFDYLNIGTWHRTADMYNRDLIKNLEIAEMTDDYLLCNITKQEGENLHLKTTNVALASFVTARARLRLYEMLEKYERRVMYHDTDSVIVEYCGHKPEVGEKLGEWSDETDGDPIISFVGLGPKTYAYKTLGGQTCVKSKGFTNGFFKYEDYREIAIEFLENGEKIIKEEEKMMFKRVNNEMITVHNVKNLIISLQKVTVVDYKTTNPHGWECVPSGTHSHPAR